jgi:hypothetical protein
VTQGHSNKQEDRLFAGQFMARTLAWTLALTCLVFLYALSLDVQWAAVYFLISLLMMANFLLLYIIGRALLTRSPSGLVVMMMFLKLLLLGGIGVAIMSLCGVKAFAVLAGINTLFIVIVLRVLGGLWFKRCV